jgi:hypothetical protein
MKITIHQNDFAFGFNFLPETYEDIGWIQSFQRNINMHNKTGISINKHNAASGLWMIFSRESQHSKKEIQKKAGMFDQLMNVLRPIIKGTK